MKRFDNSGTGALSAIGFIAVVLIVVILLGALISSIVSIDVGQAGVAFNKQTSTVDPNPLTPGWRFVSPFTTEVTKFDTWVQKEQVKASAASKDLQTASTEIALNYHIRAEDAPWIYQNLGPDYKATIIDPAIQESVKASTAMYTAEELVTKRETVREKIQEQISSKLNPMRIQVDGLSITNFDFSADFQKAIEDKQTAAQLALKAENDLARIKVEAEQKVATAEAEAKAIEIKGRALRDNPQLVDLNWVEKWDGHMPNFFVGGQGGLTSGMLLNVPVNYTRK